MSVCAAAAAAAAVSVGMLLAFLHVSGLRAAESQSVPPLSSELQREAAAAAVAAGQQWMNEQASSNKCILTQRRKFYMI